MFHFIAGFDRQNYTCLSLPTGTDSDNLLDHRLLTSTLPLVGDRTLRMSVVNETTFLTLIDHVDWPKKRQSMATRSQQS